MCFILPDVCLILRALDIDRHNVIALVIAFSCFDFLF